MGAAYPPLLRDAEIEGTVFVHFFIDTEGDVVVWGVYQSSGHAPLDEAAMRLAEVFRFSPVMLRGEPVPVWTSFPITFSVQGCGLRLAPDEVDAPTERGQLTSHCLRYRRRING